MFKVIRRSLYRIVTFGRFEIFMGTLHFNRFRGWFQISGFRIYNFPQLLFDMEFHVVIFFHESLLDKLSLDHDRHV